MHSKLNSSCILITYIVFLKPVTVVLTTTVKLNAKIFPKWSALGKALSAGKSR